MNKARPFRKSEKPILVGDWSLWAIDVYYHEPKLDFDEKHSILGNLIDEIEKHYLSDEYEYFKVGFALFHYGRRGTTISIWHWGCWSNTFEAFNQSWYCYEHDYTSLDALGIDEPVFCHLDLKVAMEELTRFSDLASLQDDAPTIMKEYLT